jgi:hypothetical protein
MKRRPKDEEPLRLVAEHRGLSGGAKCTYLLSLDLDYGRMELGHAALPDLMEIPVDEVQEVRSHDHDEGQDEQALDHRLFRIVAAGDAPSRYWIFAR